MAVMDLAPIVDGLSHEDKVDLLGHLVQDVGLDESLKAMQFYVINGNESHTMREIQFLDFVYWLEAETDESVDAKEEEENRIMAQEVEAYEQMHPELRDKYLGQYVAIHQSTLVDRDEDQMMLYHRIRDRYGDIPILMRQVRQEAIHAMRMPSSMMRLSSN